MKTRGDEVLDRSLQKIGGKGLFIKELEVAMTEDRADIAVHSMKDVPATMPKGFTIAAMLERANPADALVANRGIRLGNLPDGARIGSSSLRRQAQLRMLRPDLVVEPLRGNVNTRLAKLDNGDFDAIVLATAGLERLSLSDRISHMFSPDEILPAAGQGVVGIETLADRADLIAVLGALNHTDATHTTTAERAVAAGLQASCQSPVAAFAVVDEGELDITALVALPDGSEFIRKAMRGNASEAHELGTQLAQQLIEAGARELLAQGEAQMNSK